ncbi:MAG: peptidase U32 family protein [Chloroflexota bacterium]
MKILSPLNQPEEIEPLVSAGAAELYCGLLPEDWEYTAFSINRRQEREDNLSSFQELKECCELAHRHSVPIHLTLNEHYYTEKQYPYIKDYVNKALDAGVDALYVADVALLLTLKEWGVKVPLHISTGGTTFNSYTARFYQGLGAERIILPRHLTVEEIARIVEKVPDLPLEVFILNSKCHNIDGYCTFHHGLSEVVSKEEAREFRNGCMVDFKIHLASPVYNPEELAELAPRISQERQYLWKRVHIDSRPCGVCALYDFREMGIYSVKIVGRKNATLKKLVDSRFVRQCLDYLETDPDRDRYRQWAQARYRETYRYPCRSSMCYYPQVNPAWNTPFTSPK